MILFDVNNIGPLTLTLVVTLAIWFITILGAATVFLTRDVHPKFNISSLGFAAGILISVSIFSLILPASEISNNEPVWFPVLLGIILGVISIIVIYRVLPHHMTHHMHMNDHKPKKVMNHDNVQKTNRLLLISLALHHVPENLALGIALWSGLRHFWISNIDRSFFFSNWTGNPQFS